MPIRPVNAHKGTFGTVRIWAGSAWMPGAAALVARSAFRAGAGLVQLATPPSVLALAIGVEPGATGLALENRPLSDSRRILQGIDDGKTVLAIGPGLGLGRVTLATLQRVLDGASVPTVLDADGLNLWAKLITGQGPVSLPNSTVLTPHPGEFRRLASAYGLDLDPVDPEARAESALALARAAGAVVLLKGPQTVIADPSGPLAVNTTGSPSLATAGSGDVLTGLIAALMAQGMDPLAAAQLGAYAHGLAGEVWTREHGPRGLRAMDLADRLPGVLTSLENKPSS